LQEIDFKKRVEGTGVDSFGTPWLSQGARLKPVFRRLTFSIETNIDCYDAYSGNGDGRQTLEK